MAMEATLESVLVRTGEAVEEGDPLARLSSLALDEEKSETGLELLLEKLSAKEALSSNKYSKYQIAQQRAKIIQTRLQYIEQKIGYLTPKSPVNGRIVSVIPPGQVGVKLREGDLIAEIQPDPSFDILLQINSLDASLIKIGQEGAFVLRGLSHTNYPFTISESPSYQKTENGHSAGFMVIASLSNPDEALFKGLTGIASIRIETRRRYEIYSRGLFDYMRMFLWKHLDLHL